MYANTCIAECMHTVTFLWQYKVALGSQSGRCLGLPPGSFACIMTSQVSVSLSLSLSLSLSFARLCSFCFSRVCLSCVFLSCLCLSCVCLGRWCLSCVCLYCVPLSCFYLSCVQVSAVRSPTALCVGVLIHSVQAASLRRDSRPSCSPTICA